jgi:hypothetical protein
MCSRLILRIVVGIAAMNGVVDTRVDAVQVGCWTMVDDAFRLLLLLQAAAVVWRVPQQDRDLVDLVALGCCNLVRRRTSD